MVGDKNKFFKNISLLSFFQMALTSLYPGFVYYPHQTEAVSWMQDREAEDAAHFRGGILALEMGMGKTNITIALMIHSPYKNNLLLTPPVLQGQWSEALQRSAIPHRIMTTKGRWREIAGTTDVHVTIATFDRAANSLTALGDILYDRIVCDEGHIFRNGTHTKRFRKLVSIAAPCRWILSGTPIQNRVQDIKNLFSFLGMKETSYSVAKVASETMHRRIVSEVRDTVPTMPASRPNHFVHPVSLPIGSEEEHVFQSLVGRFEHAVESHATASIILELYLRIRQFLAHPTIYVEAMKRKYKDTYKRTDWTGTASKLTVFKRMLSDLPAAPTIVFGTFRAELEYAEAALRAAGYKTWMIRGGMTDAARDCAIKDSAAEGGNSIAIVIQIVSGGAGLNLQHCNRIIFLSSHWNPAMVDQATARAYRIGQTMPVSVHHLLLADDAEKNLDRYMAYKHGTKRAAAISVHPNLYCDSAIATTTVMEELDAVLLHNNSEVEDEDPIESE